MPRLPARMALLSWPDLQSGDLLERISRRDLGVRLSPHAARSASASARNRSRFEHLGAQRSVDPRLRRALVEHAGIAARAWSAASCARSCDAGRRRRRRAATPRRAASGSVDERTPLEPQHRRVDARRRQEAAARHGEAACRRGEKPQLDGVGAVLLVARGRGHAVGDLGLHHDGRRCRARAAPGRSAGRPWPPRRRAGWRRAPSAGRRARTSSAGATATASARTTARRGHSAVVSASAGSSCASRSTATTAPACVAERDGERAEAGADLEHGLVAGERGELEDAADDVVVDEEVLAERLLGGQAVALQDLDRRRGSGERGVRHASRER